ncbi:hypothetical protein [Erythrobacter aureus]|nr:hypothetical protein [Erythrobacter aureus]
MFDDQGFCRISGRTFMRRDDIGPDPHAVMSGNFEDCKAACAEIDGSFLLAPAAGVRGRATWLVCLCIDHSTMRPDNSAERVIAYESETSDYWVKRKGKGRFELLHNESCGASVKGQFSATADPARALGWAMRDLFRREVEEDFVRAAA